MSLDRMDEVCATVPVDSYSTSKNSPDPVLLTT